MEYRSLYWEDVVEGEALPPIEYELSLLRMVALVRATGLYDYVHFDRDYAQAVGARDVFMATPHVAGLFSRLLTDWSGPEADIRSLTFSMNAQSCSNDLLTITGKVGRKYVSEAGEHLVDVIDMNIGHALAPQAATASATLALPSRTGGAVGPRPAGAQQPRPEAGPDLPDFARAMLGTVKAGNREPAWPLSEHEIHLWCECLEDWNPLYWDQDFASASRYGGIVAPPASMFYGPGTAAHMGIGYLKPGTAVPAAVRQGLTGVALLKELRKNMVEASTPFMPPGCPEVAVVRAHSEYFLPLRPGDSARTEQRLLSCSPLKRTKLGEGHFMSWINSVYNQREELVRTFTLTVFHYRV